MTSHFLTLLLLLPVLGAMAIWFCARGITGNKDTITRVLALVTSLLELGLVLVLWLNFDASSDDLQFAERFEWFSGFNIYYFIAVDGVSMPFILLTAFLIPICIISSWYSITSRVQEFLMIFLIMESLIIGVFCAFDFLLFYLFFEAVLIPMYLIIGIWGGNDRVYAAYKFFLYTLAGSLFLLLAITYMYYQVGTTDIIQLAEFSKNFDANVQKILWLAMLASFAVKLPMWPVHTWLPDAHVQAPTAGSVLLAGILLKLGGYGFIRFSLPMFPVASLYYADLMMWLSIIAVIYTSLVALMQEDMKKLIAYSSIAHMGFVTAGLFSFTTPGTEGAVFQMISHGLISAALFLCVGVLYDRMHTKEISFYNGLTTKMLRFAFHFMFFMLASIGLPITSGFVGEFLVLLGVFEYSKLFSALVALGMVLGAAYMLWLFARLMFGEIKNTKLIGIQDLTTAESLLFWPLGLAIIVLGIYPNFVLTDLHTAVTYIEAIYTEVMNTDNATVLLGEEE